MDAEKHSDSHRNLAAGYLLCQSKSGQHNLQTFKRSISIELVPSTKERQDNTNGAQSPAFEWGNNTGFCSAPIYESDGGGLWWEGMLWDA